MWRTLTALIGITLTLALVPEVGAQRADRGSRATQGIGVIQYDPGSPDGVRFADPPYDFVGNLFNTQSGQTLSPGSITGVSWYQGPATTKGFANIMIVPGSPASPIYTGVSGAQPYAFNSVTFAPIPVAPPFFVGLFARNPQSPAQQGQVYPQIGYASTTYNGQGFHGSQRGGTVPPFGARAPIPDQNLLVRAAGNVAIPVELLEFEVE